MASNAIAAIPAHFASLGMPHLDAATAPQTTSDAAHAAAADNEHTSSIPLALSIGVPLVLLAATAGWFYRARGIVAAAESLSAKGHAIVKVGLDAGVAASAASALRSTVGEAVEGLDAGHRHLTTLHEKVVAKIQALRDSALAPPEANAKPEEARRMRLAADAYRTALSKLIDEIKNNLHLARNWLAQDATRPAHSGIELHNARVQVSHAIALEGYLGAARTFAGEMKRSCRGDPSWAAGPGELHDLARKIEQHAEAAHMRLSQLESIVATQGHAPTCADLFSKSLVQASTWLVDVKMNRATTEALLIDPANSSLPGTTALENQQWESAHTAPHTDLAVCERWLEDLSEEFEKAVKLAQTQETLAAAPKADPAQQLQCTNNIVRSAQKLHTLIGQLQAEAPIFARYGAEYKTRYETAMRHLEDTVTAASEMAQKV